GERERLVEVGASALEVARALANHGALEPALGEGRGELDRARVVPLGPGAVAEPVVDGAADAEDRGDARVELRGRVRVLERSLGVASPKAGGGAVLPRRSAGRVEDDRHHGVGEGPVAVTPIEGRVRAHGPRLDAAWIELERPVERRDRAGEVEPREAPLR